MCLFWLTNFMHEFRKHWHSSLNFVATGRIEARSESFFTHTLCCFVFMCILLWFHTLCGIMYGYTLEVHNLPEVTSHLILTLDKVYVVTKLQTPVSPDKKLQVARSKHRTDNILFVYFSFFLFQVATLFRHTSLGNTVNMVLTSLLILEDDQVSLKTDSYILAIKGCFWLVASRS